MQWYESNQLTIRIAMVQKQPVNNQDCNSTKSNQLTIRIAMVQKQLVNNKKYNVKKSIRITFRIIMSKMINLIYNNILGGAV